MKILLNAKHHRVTKRWFGNNTPSIEGSFGPYSLKNKQDRANLCLIADRILIELRKEE